MNILRILNTLFLAAILATLVLILLHLGQPIQVRQPVAIEGWGGLAQPLEGSVPVSVSIDEQPVHVEIDR